MATLRSKELEESYGKYLGDNPISIHCPLCSKASIKEFKYWRIVKNSFPYDVIASVHDMILPIRHSTENDLSNEEIEELLHIKYNYIGENYQYLMESAHGEKSIPEHFHLHLLVIK